MWPFTQFYNLVLLPQKNTNYTVSNLNMKFEDAKACLVIE